MDVRTTDFQTLKLAVSADPLLLLKRIHHVEDEAEQPQPSASSSNVQNSDDGVTMLWQAAALGLTEHVRFLCDFSAEISSREVEEAGLLNAVLELNGFSETVPKFLSVFSDINFRRAKGLVSPLYIAAQNDHHDCCEVLLTLGKRAGNDDNNGGGNKKRNVINVNIRRDTNATPLFIATQRNNLSIMNLLLSSSSSSAVNSSIRTADAFGDDDDDNNEMSSNRCGLGTVTMSQSSAIEVDVENSQRCTPFVLACSMGHTEAAMLLLSYGANHNNNNTGLSGLHWAKREKRIETYKMLMEMIFLPEMSLRFLFQGWRSFVAMMKIRRRDAIITAESEQRQMIRQIEGQSVDGITTAMRQERANLDKLLGNTLLPTFEILKSVELENAAIEKRHLNITATNAFPSHVTSRRQSIASSVATTAVVSAVAPPTDDDQPIVPTPLSSSLSRRMSAVSAVVIPQPDNDHDGDDGENENDTVAALETAAATTTTTSTTPRRRRTVAHDGRTPESLRHWHLHRQVSDQDASNGGQVNHQNIPTSSTQAAHHSNFYTQSPKTNLEYFAPHQRRLIVQQHLRATNALIAEQQQFDADGGGGGGGDVLYPFDAVSQSTIEPLRGHHYSVASPEMKMRMAMAQNINNSNVTTTATLTAGGGADPNHHHHDPFDVMASEARRGPTRFEDPNFMSPIRPSNASSSQNTGIMMNSNSNVHGGRGPPHLRTAPIAPTPSKNSLAGRALALDDLVVSDPSAYTLNTTVATTNLNASSSPPSFSSASIDVASVPRHRTDFTSSPAMALTPSQRFEFAQQLLYEKQETERIIRLKEQQQVKQKQQQRLMSGMSGVDQSSALFYQKTVDGDIALSPSVVAAATAAAAADQHHRQQQPPPHPSLRRLTLQTSSPLYSAAELAAPPRVLQSIAEEELWRSGRALTAEVRKIHNNKTAGSGGPSKTAATTSATNAFSAVPSNPNSYSSSSFYTSTRPQKTIPERVVPSANKDADHFYGTGNNRHPLLPHQYDMNGGGATAAAAARTMKRAVSPPSAHHNHHPYPSAQGTTTTMLDHEEYYYNEERALFGYPTPLHSHQQQQDARAHHRKTDGPATTTAASGRGGSGSEYVLQRSATTGRLIKTRVPTPTTSVTTQRYAAAR